MKLLIILSLLLSTSALADIHLKIDDIKGEATEVIDNEENAANDVTITNTGDEDSGEINGQIEMLSPNLESKTKAQDYNSSRSNKRGARASKGDHNSTRSNRGRKLDTDDDDDGVDTLFSPSPSADAVDNDCDDDCSKTQ